MSGGKGSSQTTSVAVPEYIEAAAQRNLNKAEAISQLGYTPYYGPDVAAFSPAQQAAFQNTAGAAGAFGLASPTDPFGGMGAPTDFGGVQGYSSAPLYQQSVDALAANRPGQKQYIDSFFIDPMTGQAGAGVQPAIDYTAYNTAAQDARNAAQADRANDLAIAQAQAGAGPQNVYNFTPSTEVLVGPTNVGVGGTTVGGQEVQYANQDINYEDAFTASNGQQVGVLNPNSAALSAMQAEYGVDPSFYTETPIHSASDFPLGSSLSGTDYTEYASPSENSTASNQYGSNVSVGYGSGQVDPGLAAGAGYSSGSNANSGGYTSFSDMFDGGGPGQSGGAFSGGGAISDVANAATNNNGSGDGGNGGDGCVVATHAVSSGAFTASEKRQAVVWCMSALHGKWWGEAVRRGYRHLGNKKIQQGKAREHYAEFRRYIDFASGKKRTARGGITFALRTAQFFVVGLAKRGA